VRSGVSITCETQWNRSTRRDAKAETKCWTEKSKQILKSHQQWVGNVEWHSTECSIKHCFTSFLLSKHNHWSEEIAFLCVWQSRTQCVSCFALNPKHSKNLRWFLPAMLALMLSAALPTIDRQTHRTNTPIDAKPILDFEVILQFRSRLVSLFL